MELGTDVASSLGVVSEASVTTYALLGMLATRPWTGYELTQQLRRSLHFVWPASEGHLYREQKRLIDLGWAEVEREQVGKRQRNLYTITADGHRALVSWLGTEPSSPRLEIEGLLRVFYGSHGSIGDMVSSLEATARMAGSLRGEMLGFVEEYLEKDGPLSLLEAGLGGPGRDRIVFRGRPQFPERLHVVALVIDITTRVLAEIERSFMETADEVRDWPSPVDATITQATRERLERIQGGPQA